MATEYVMRAFKTSLPSGHVYWPSVGSPDLTGALSGYNPSELISITVDYTITTPVSSNGSVVNANVGGDLSGIVSSATVVGLQSRPISPNAPITNQVLQWNGSSWVPAGITGASDIVQVGNNTDVTVASSTANVSVGMKALSATRNVILPSGPGVGLKINVKDLDGSLATQNIVINGNGNTIDGSSTFTMTNTLPGPKSSISILFFSNVDGWGII